VIVVATLAEDTWYNYAIGFPFADLWREVFNSDVYDNFVNPIVAGNAGGNLRIRSAIARFLNLSKNGDPGQWLRCLCPQLKAHWAFARAPGFNLHEAGRMPDNPNRSATTAWELKKSRMCATFVRRFCVVYGRR
jgi:hypothetical protein